MGPGKVKMHKRQWVFLAHRCAALLIILLVGTGLDLRSHWCKASLPLCNQAQTTWLEGVNGTQTLISTNIHMVYKPLWAPRTRPQDNQGGYFFHAIKIPEVLLLLIDVNWISPPPLSLSGFPDSWVIGIWHRNIQYAAFSIEQFVLQN